MEDTYSDIILKLKIASMLSVLLAVAITLFNIAKSVT